MTNLQLPEDQYILLKDGVKYPKIGLGTWKSPHGKTGEAVKAAIRSGYRMIDTANDYNNEHEIGQAIKELIDAGEVKREELFIQSKLWNANHRPENAWIDIKKTLEDLQMDYIDAFVIHWPQACPSHPTGAKPGIRKSGAFPGLYTEERPEGGCWMFSLDEEGKYTYDADSHYVETLHAMEEMKDKGLIRTIGVSNFNKAQVRECIEACKKHPLTIVQNEVHPYFQQKDFVDFCQHNGVAVQAFSPLGSADRPSCYKRDTDPKAVLENETIAKIAAKHNKTPAQAVLRWHIQRNVSAVPKSITPSRVEANHGVWDFKLDEEDLKTFSSLNIGWQFLLWEDTAGHPDYPFKDALPLGFKPGKAPLATTTAS
eukprot:TRINITY_DN3358_c0_g1_i10.p1 TRINITY_DN3358_c0_g1~~TRINITY_DN3358_c0_g1_i10.p1  ORF type:complete len:370 (+),score=198.61 TRINITY_DN3358_c0_g1_i10:60-1169(+)